MPRSIRGRRESREEGVEHGGEGVAMAVDAVASTSKAPLSASPSKGAADDDEGTRAAQENGSPNSMNRDRSTSKRQEASSSAVPASPPAMASDMSTSGESDLELELDNPQTARANISLVDEHADGDEDDEMNEGGATAMDDGSPEVKCMWEDCGLVFTSLASFISHLHDEHVGIHKHRYACEWTGCPRKGKGQTSRFALLSHLRSHTGEKPFTCPRPECDKSFTRSDALAKHMRVQHNINPVTSRSKNAGSAAMTGGRAVRRGEGEEENWPGYGLEADAAGRAGASDVVGDELLELVEGETNGSLADIEQSLLMLDSKSPFFTYDNLFGIGARALANHDRLGSGGKKAVGSADAVKPSFGPIPDAELGIERDTEYGAGLLLNDDVRDEEAIAREENEMARILEAGRRQWVRRERENAELRPDVEEGRREVIDYLSDDEVEAADTSVRSSKRIRRNSSRTAAKQTAVFNDAGTIKRLYIVEKAKLRWIRRENEKMRASLAELRQVERQEMAEKRVLLERSLEVELGKEVGAIFSPPGSPR